MTKCELMFDSSRNKEVEIRECVIDAIDLIQRIYEAAFPKLVSQGAAQEFFCKLSESQDEGGMDGFISR